MLLTPAASPPAGAAVRLLSADQRFERCDGLVIALEGGAKYTNNPKDRGGPTKFGVTLRALADRRGGPVTAEDVQALTLAEASAIYRAVYWASVRGDQLPAGVDLIVFDAAVNCGRGRAVTFLQAALRVPADGVFGPQTLRAVQAADDLSALVERIRLERLRHYRQCEAFPTFGKGWLNRLSSVAQTAKAWAVKA